MEKHRKKKSKTRPRNEESGGARFSRENRERVLGKVNQFAESLCTAEGLELVHSEFLREPAGRILRLYIDKPDGVTLDECAHISRQMGDYLDVGLENIGPYSLEVSSPGPERPLGKASDFDRFRGRTAKISTYQALDGKKNFTGMLDGTADGSVCLTLGEKQVKIPISEIRRARLINGES